MSVSLVMCTAPQEEAAALADQLLSEKLVACVNMIGPVASRYRWQGALEESQEILLFMKTSTSLVDRLRDRVVELHSYDVPEILEFRADSGLAAYTDWVAKSCE